MLTAVMLNTYSSWFWFSSACIL